MIEPPHERRPTQASRVSDSDDRPTLHTQASRLTYLALILPAAFVASGHTATAFLVQTVGGSNVAAMTWRVAAIVLAEGIGSAIAMGVRDVGLQAQVAIGLVGAVTLGIGLAVGPLLIASAMVLSLLDGLVLPLRSVAIQRLADDAVRARAASLASACDMALKTIALPLAGRWRGRRRFLR